MSEELYDIVFKGELVKSVDPAVAKQNVGKLFKMDGAKLDALFSGKTIVLKRGLNFDTASKYRVAIKKAGAVVNLQAQQNNVPQPAKPSPGKAVFGERPSQVPAAASQTVEAPAAREPDAAQPAKAADNGAFSIAPVGSDMIEAKDRPRVEVVSVDITGISVKEGGGDLLEESEKRSYEPAQIDVSAFDIAPVGADVLKENERKKIDAVDVDTSALGIAEVGARLSEPKPAPPPAPDVSRISLAD